MFTPGPPDIRRSRRRFLQSATVVGLVPVAGCLGDDDADQPTPTPDPSMPTPPDDLEQVDLTPTGLCPADAEALELCVPFGHLVGDELRDESGHGRHGTVTGDATVVDGGPDGFALRLTDNAADGIDFATSLPLEARLTVSVWVRPDDEATPWQTVVGEWANNAGYWLGSAQTAGGVEWWINDTPIAADTGFAAGVWSHLAATYDADAGAMALYVNAEEVARSTAAPDAIDRPPTTLQVGRGGAGNPFAGQLAGLRVWSDARDQAQLCADAGGTVADGGCAIDEIVDAAPLDDAQPGINIPTAPVDGLQFYVHDPEGATGYYYGTSTADSLDVTHVAVDDGTGVPAVIIFNEAFYPVHWMFEDVTFAAMRTDNPGFNPAATPVIMNCADGETSLTFDIELTDVVEHIVDRIARNLASEFTQPFDRAKQVIEQVGVAGHTVDEVVDIARSSDDASEAAATIASAVTTGGVGVEILDNFNVPGIPMQSTISQMFGYLGRIADGEYDADNIPGPSVAMLLCRGASMFPGECHHYYLVNQPGNATKCVQRCVVTLDCFTDICHPTHMSVDEALGFRANY